MAVISFELQYYEQLKCEAGRNNDGETSNEIQEVSLGVHQKAAVSWSV